MNIETANQEMGNGQQSLVERMLDSTAYDPTIALFLARLSAWAYSPDFQSAFDDFQLSQFGDAPASGGHGFLPVVELKLVNDPLFVCSHVFFLRSRCGRLGVLCYRGTEPINLMNWLTDASIHCEKVEIGESVTVPVNEAPGNPTEPTTYVDVHGGFYRNVLATWPKVLAQVDDALQAKHDGDVAPLQTLYVTGHSLGGAMAVLAGALILGAEPNGSPLRQALRFVYTYGQPRVGRRSFRERFESDLGRILFRHVFANDIVPMLPPRSAGRFEHIGFEYRARSEMTGWTLSHVPRRQLWSAMLGMPFGVLAWGCQQVPWLSRLRFPYSWDDHSPIHYLKSFGIPKRGHSELEYRMHMAGFRALGRPAPTREAVVSREHAVRSSDGRERLMETVESPRDEA